jgi:hypothetical protein
MLLHLDVGVDVLYTAMAKSAFGGATAQVNVPTSTAGVANVAVGNTQRERSENPGE